MKNSGFGRLNIYVTGWLVLTLVGIFLIPLLVVPDGSKVEAAYGGPLNNGILAEVGDTWVYDVTYGGAKEEWTYTVTALEQKNQFNSIWIYSHMI